MRILNSIRMNLKKAYKSWTIKIEMNMKFMKFSTSHSKNRMK